MKKNKKGYFIVFEGTDGSGKGTQIQPLTAYLKSQGTDVEVIDFPRYKDNVWGELVGQYLKGNYGSLESVDPHLAALPYVLDRMLAKPVIERWLSEGKIVIANRYATSNLAFMAAKLPVSQRDDYIKWLENAEYNVNGIPREDLVLLLNVIPDVSHGNVAKKDAREYLQGRKRDIHEDNLAYQKEVAKVYLYLAAKKNHWRVIDCMNNGQLKSPEQITDLLIQTVNKELDNE